LVSFFFLADYREKKRLFFFLIVLNQKTKAAAAVAVRACICLLFSREKLRQKARRDNDDLL